MGNRDFILDLLCYLMLKLINGAEFFILFQLVVQTIGIESFTIDSIQLLPERVDRVLSASDIGDHFFHFHVQLSQKGEILVTV
jgi:hypothetical protein